ncbi:MAG: phenylalanine--tRNA ligase subunit beta [Phycisphaeraceae bacterium]|nr:phenylalanine--tRNA ligase subunit beta [Phycisphaeraceae bacterium]
MHISLRWLNQYLHPQISAAEAESVLTSVGFPIESVQSLPGGDTLLDVEVTSNRGDCLSHVGLAREIAACVGGGARSFRPPEAGDPHHTGRGTPARQVFSLSNTVPEACPYFTAQVIRGVKIGPSPAWLSDALEAVGQRSINNVVDVTNWLCFELGQPSHVFDLARLAGSSLVIRWAKSGEKLKTLDGKERELQADELVVADSERAQSLAGVIGGFDSQVTEATTDIVLEAATWDPTVVRRGSRRHRVRTDASARFERWVDPRTVQFAAWRAARLILDVAGGELAPGFMHEGRPLDAAARITFRPSRCRGILGIETPVAEIIRIFRALEIEVTQRDEDTLLCEPPAWRSADLVREIDLIEEVARVRGMNAVPTLERLPIVAGPAQRSEGRRRELGAILTGQGFFETVTFSFTTPVRAEAFLPQGLEAVGVDDERRGAEPTLRPSLLPSLLQCRRANQDGQVEIAGGVRFFERAAVFAQAPGGGRRTVERRVVGLLADVVGSGKKRSFEELQASIRMMRGVVEAVTMAFGGGRSVVTVKPAEPPAAGWDRASHGEIVVHSNGKVLTLGRSGLIAERVQREYGLEVPVVAAELDEGVLLDLSRPVGGIDPLPGFPSIERDLSAIVDEGVTWNRIVEVVRECRLGHCEDVGFVGSYRGKQVGEGKKSVTLRLRFRAPDQTLRHEDVDPQMTTLAGVLEREVAAVFRTT